MTKANKWRNYALALMGIVLVFWLLEKIFPESNEILLLKWAAIVPATITTLIAFALLFKGK
ncbi:hypothetical protein HUU53_04380 [Candidatus Micrarchaeota archaeon]|nr:hypothetical protein [Candidatus Micrarchaeota archaeon]